MKRRSVLAGPGAVFALVTPGCTIVGSSNEEQQYTFGVHNLSDGEHTFTIRVWGDLLGYFFEDVVVLDGGKADTDIPFDGTPVRVSVEVDSNNEQHYPWPASHSGSGKISETANIYYEPDRNQEIVIYG